MVRVKVKQRNSGRKFKEKLALPDENDDAITGVWIIRRKNAKPGVSTIGSQSSVFRDPERGRRGEVGFLGTDEIHIIKRDKNGVVKLCWLKEP